MSGYEFSEKKLTCVIVVKIVALLLSACTIGANNDPVISYDDPVETSLVEVPLPAPGQPPTDHSANGINLPLIMANGPRCVAQVAKAERSVAILSSPTLVATIDKYGDGQVVASYDLVNLKSMKNVRKSAMARCSLDAHLDMVKALQKLSARGLSRNGAMARVGFIDRRLRRFDEIRREVSAASRAGKIKEKARDKVLKVVGAIVERSNILRAKAMSQPEIDFNSLVPLHVLEHSLNVALHEQHQLNVDAEVSKNVRLILSGGYQFDDEEGPVDDLELEGFARASLSVRLGIFNPGWKYGQNQEFFAELEKLHEPGVGALWRAVDTFEKNKIALSALKEMQSLLTVKVSQQRKRNRSFASEMFVEKILGEIELVKLRSELVEVETNLKTVAKAQQLLKL